MTIRTTLENLCLLKSMPANDIAEFLHDCHVMRGAVELELELLDEAESKMDRSAFDRKVAEQCKPLVSGAEEYVERRVSFTFSRRQLDGDQFQPAVHEAMREYMGKAEAYRPFERDSGDNPGMDYSASNGVRIQIKPLDDPADSEGPNLCDLPCLPRSYFVKVPDHSAALDTVKVTEDGDTIGVRVIESRMRPLDPVGIAGDEPMPDPLSEGRMPVYFEPAAQPFLVGAEADEEPFSSATFAQEFIKP